MTRNKAKPDAEVTLNLWDKRALLFVDGDLPERVHNEIEEQLSFEVPGAQYSDSYRDGSWDGIERLYRTSKNGKRYFPVGLLPTVTNILDLNGINYTVNGVTREGRGDIEYDWPDDITLRDYQKEIVKTALQSGMGTIVAPTGTGKTLTGLRIIHELQHPVMVVTSRTEVADQWVDRIETHLGESVGKCYGGDRENKDVMVALYQSIYDADSGDVRDDVVLDHPVLIQDEAHESAADTYQSVALAHSAQYRYGFTATYNRESNDELKIDAGTGPVIADLDVEEMIDNGWLAEPRFEILEPPRLDGRYRNWQDELAAVCHDNARNEMLVEKTESLIEDGVERILMDVRRVAHGERLEALCEERGIDARFVYSETSDRQEHLADFEDGEYPVLISTLVDTGWDCPELEAVILATPTKSATSNIQTVGRSLRPSTDEAIIVDVRDTGKYTGEWFENRYRDFADYYQSHGP